MYGFCRLGVRPAPFHGWNLGLERARDEDEHQEEVPRDGRDDRDGPGQDLCDEPPVEQDGCRAEPGQDQHPEEQGAFLTAPEGGERVAGRQIPARMVGNVAQREVVGEERAEQDCGRRQAGDERRNERVAGRVGEAPSPAVGGVRAGDDCIEREPESDDERGATEPGHANSRRSSSVRTSTGTSSRGSPASRRTPRSEAHPGGRCGVRPGTGQEPSPCTRPRPSVCRRSP